MRIRAVLTDLDGTLLEPDGSVCAEGCRRSLRVLREQGVPVCPLTSKTAAELATCSMLDLATARRLRERRRGRSLADGTSRPAPGRGAGRRAFGSPRATPRGARPARPCAPSTNSATTSSRRSPGFRRRRSVGARRGRRRCPCSSRTRGTRPCAALLPSRRCRLIRGNRFLHLQGHTTRPTSFRGCSRRAGEASWWPAATRPTTSSCSLRPTCQVIVPSAIGAAPRASRGASRRRGAPLPHGRGWAASLRISCSRRAGRLGRGRRVLPARIAAPGAAPRSGQVDVLVGIPSYNNARTIGHVVRAVQAGLAKYFPGPARAAPQLRRGLHRRHPGGRAGAPRSPTSTRSWRPTRCAPCTAS